MTEKKNEDMQEVSRLRWDCPHCGSFMKVRTSKTPLSEYRELYLHCTNEFDCGFRGKARVSIDETLVPSHCPNPEVNIRPSDWLLKKLALEAQGQIRLTPAQPKKEPTR